MPTQRIARFLFGVTSVANAARRAPSGRFRPLLLATVCVVMAADAGSQASAAAQANADCVSIGTPRPKLGYTYRYKDSRGSTSEYTHRWDEVSATGSRARTTKLGTGGRSASTSVNRHRIVDDVTLIEQSTSSGTDASGPFRNTTTFRPGVVGDPAFRACAGRSWRIPSVTATHQSARGKYSARSDGGELKILALRESITVPAGRFDTVHYTRATHSPLGRVMDEYWKSIEHGVTVKHLSTLPGATAGEVLVSIAP